MYLRKRRDDFEISGLYSMESRVSVNGRKHAESGILVMTSKYKFQSKSTTCATLVESPQSSDMVYSFGMLQAASLYSSVISVTIVRLNE